MNLSRDRCPKIAPWEDDQYPTCLSSVCFGLCDCYQYVSPCFIPIVYLFFIYSFSVLSSLCSDSTIICCGCSNSHHTYTFIIHHTSYIIYISLSSLSLSLYTFQSLFYIYISFYQWMLLILRFSLSSLAPFSCRLSDKM